MVLEQSTALDVVGVGLGNGKVVLHEAQLPGVKPTGKLGFQNHGNPLEFANIFVKEL